VLRRVRPKVYQDLSPRWQGQSLANRLGRVEVPIWGVAGVLGILLFGLYIMLRTFLGGGSDLTTDALSTLHPSASLTLERRVLAPPPPPPPPPPPNVVTQLQRIRARLAAEISAGKVIAEQSATQIFIRVGDVVLFDPGQAAVLDSFKPIIPRIAASLDPEPGNIKVIGHTDNQPIKSMRFPSNFHLSVERARVVGALLKQSLSQPGRLEPPIGRGADAPIAPNDSAQGRARNRRVEIIIPRAD
jgi:type VI secretion system protein ImpK